MNTTDKEKSRHIYQSWSKMICSIICVNAWFTHWKKFNGCVGIVNGWIDDFAWRIG